MQGVSAAEDFVVKFDEYEGQETVNRACIRPLPEAMQIYRGVTAPKRKKVEEEPIVQELPKWLEVKVHFNWPRLHNPFQSHCLGCAN